MGVGFSGIYAIVCMYFAFAFVVNKRIISLVMLALVISGRSYSFHNFAACFKVSNLKLAVVAGIYEWEIMCCSFVSDSIQRSVFYCGHRSLYFRI